MHEKASMAAAIIRLRRAEYLSPPLSFSCVSSPCPYTFPSFLPDRDCLTEYTLLKLHQSIQQEPPKSCVVAPPPPSVASNTPPPPQAKDESSKGKGKEKSEEPQAANNSEKQDEKKEEKKGSAHALFDLSVCVLLNTRMLVLV